MVDKQGSYWHFLGKEQQGGAEALLHQSGKPGPGTFAIRVLNSTEGYPMGSMAQYLLVTK